MSSLQHAINAVYTAFDDIPRPIQVDGCPCCIGEKGINILLAKPLGDLTPDDLTHYAASAFLTVGDVPDYLYFLPRILEIAATEDGWWPDPEVITRAIHTAGFYSWPSDHREAVEAYFDAVLDHLLNTHDSGSALDSWICALGRLHVPIRPLLERIAAVPLRLLDFYETNSKDLAKGHLSNGFWEDAPVERDEVLAWFQSDDIQHRIQQVYGLA